MLREWGKEEAQQIADTMNVHCFTLDQADTPETMPLREKQRHPRFTYGHTIRQKEIGLAFETGKQNDSNRWLFVALSGMVGNTEFGFYPLFNESKPQIDKKITDCLSELVKVQH